MFVMSNVSLLNSFNKVTKNKTAKNELVEKLSSGKRINRAADDSAGLSISESLKAQVRGMSMAEKNIQDGVSMLQVADGAMDDITKTLHRMKEVVVQASNGVLTDEDRDKLQEEFSKLKDNIDYIANETEFNTIKLLDKDKTLTFQVKDNPYTSYSLNLFANDTTALSLDKVNVSDFNNAIDANGKIDNALEKTISHRTELGAHLNNLQHSFKDASNEGSNLTTSLSQIEDVHMATALMNSVKQNILINSNKSMLCVAKQNNENVNTVLNKWLL
ncbi:flagellin [Clostridium botulinum]|uniref:Flagellin n=2 Tax=Clostridium botulinum TaxID=1491 RepID=A0A0A0IQQ9_CLOBO|nr:flagellin [Clostridium botulinum]KGN01846.1 flagellin [Clostridium botulinum C/D str. DC5]KOC55706.1 flagellin [Clostridium botulinum]KOC57613.1 flagellin [Clostridium botulinum]MCD3232823.1 flagellin [Clostridium botulinum D/C]MCD3238685.1 flagellin [Clostridium botulinum D/C]